MSIIVKSKNVILKKDLLLKVENIVMTVIKHLQINQIFASYAP